MPAVRIDPDWWRTQAFNGEPLVNALARRDIATVFRFLRNHGFSQAAITAHTGIAENRVRTILGGESQVTAYEVLERIAEGLQIPRELMGLGFETPAGGIRQSGRPELSGETQRAAPPRTASTDHASNETPSADALGEMSGPVLEVDSAQTSGWYRRDPGPAVRIAICGSRCASADPVMLDEAIVALSRWLMRRRCHIDHGPMGIGIEIMTYVADHYRPPTLQAVVGIFGRANVVRNADYILVIGGGAGTQDEIDLAISMDKRLVPFVGSGGAAVTAYERLHRDVSLRAWLPEPTFAALGTCTRADDFVELVDRILLHEHGSAQQ